jgi:hypothetical protein
VTSSFQGTDKMPPPMLQAPALTQAHPACQDTAATMRDDIESAVKAARTATRSIFPPARIIDSARYSLDHFEDVEKVHFRRIDAVIEYV